MPTPRRRPRAPASTSAPARRSAAKLQATAAASAAMSGRGVNASSSPARQGAQRAGLCQRLLTDRNLVLADRVEREGVGRLLGDGDAGVVVIGLAALVLHDRHAPGDALGPTAPGTSVASRVEISSPGQLALSPFTVQSTVSDVDQALGDPLRLQERAAVEVAEVQLQAPERAPGRSARSAPRSPSPRPAGSPARRSPPGPDTRRRPAQHVDRPAVHQRRRPGSRSTPRPPSSSRGPCRALRRDRSAAGSPCRPSGELGDHPQRLVVAGRGQHRHVEHRQARRQELARPALHLLLDVVGVAGQAAVPELGPEVVATASSST